MELINKLTRIPKNILSHLLYEKERNLTKLLELWIVFVTYVSCLSQLYCLVGSLQLCDHMLEKG